MNEAVPMPTPTPSPIAPAPKSAPMAVGGGPALLHVVLGLQPSSRRGGRDVDDGNLLGELQERGQARGLGQPGRAGEVAQPGVERLRQRRHTLARPCRADVPVDALDVFDRPAEGDVGRVGPGQRLPRQGRIVLRRGERYAGILACSLECLPAHRVLGEQVSAARVRIGQQPRR